MHQLACAWALPSPSNAWFRAQSGADECDHKVFHALGHERANVPFPTKKTDARSRRLRDRDARQCAGCAVWRDHVRSARMYYARSLKARRRPVWAWTIIQVGVTAFFFSCLCCGMLRTCFVLLWNTTHVLSTRHSLCIQYVANLRDDWSSRVNRSMVAHMGE